MRVRWLRAALRNLEDEASFIAAEDPRAAQPVVQRILAAVALLAEQPGIGGRGRVPGTR
jgi:plasmid stabilization system protein ParE